MSQAQQPLPEPRAPQPAGATPGPEAFAPVDPSTLPGVEVTYFAVKIGGAEGKAVGLFRVSDDDDAQVLTLERLTADGEWEDDPALIDDVHSPGVFAVDENEAQSIESQVLSGSGGGQSPV